MTIHQIHILLALRYAETLPGHGKGFAGKVSSGDVGVARAMARRGIVRMGRVPAPGHGNTVALTDSGREFADRLIGTANAMLEAEVDIKREKVADG